MTSDSWQEFFQRNLGKVLGVLLGLLLGWMIIEYGFFKTLFVIVLVVTGYMVGKKADDDEDVWLSIRKYFKGY